MFIRLAGKQDHYVNLRNVTHVQLCGGDLLAFGKGERVVFHFAGGGSLILELPAREVARLHTALAISEAEAAGSRTDPGGDDDTPIIG